MHFQYRNTPGGCRSSSDSFTTRGILVHLPDYFSEVRGNPNGNVGKNKKNSTKTAIQSQDQTLVPRDVSQQC